MDLDKLIQQLEEKINKLEHIEEEKENIDNIFKQDKNNTINSNNNINIWESKFTEYCTFFITYEELINYIKKIKHTKIIIHEKQNPEDHDKSQLDFITRQNNISITYTDKQHPITILNYFETDTPDILINPNFFEKYKNNK